MRTMQRVMRASKAPGRLRLSGRITQLEAALAEARAMIAKHEGGREIVPAALYEVERKVAADLSWLRELRSLRAGTGAIISGDHGAISRWLAAALEEELLLRVTHTLLQQMAKKGRTS